MRGVVRAAEELVVVAGYCGGAVLDGIYLARLAAVFLHGPGHCGGAALGKSAHGYRIARGVGQDGDCGAAGSPVLLVGAGVRCGGDVGRIIGTCQHVLGRAIEVVKVADGDARKFFGRTCAAFARGGY